MVFWCFWLTSSEETGDIRVTLRLVTDFRLYLKSRQGLVKVKMAGFRTNTNSFGR